MLDAITHASAVVAAGVTVNSWLAAASRRIYDPVYVVVRLDARGKLFEIFDCEYSDLTKLPCYSKGWIAVVYV